MASSPISERLKKYRMHDLKHREEQIGWPPGEKEGETPAERPQSPARRLPKPSSDAPPSFPRLTESCLGTISSNLGVYERPLQETVGPELWTRLSPKVPLDLSIALAIPRISDEEYWRRRVKRFSPSADYPNEGAGDTWKQKCIEYNLRTAVEAIQSKASEEDIEAVLSLARVASPYVTTLTVRQAGHNLDVGKLCLLLQNLEILRLTYGPGKLGMGFDKSLFGIKSTEVESLSSFVSQSHTLKVLDLSSNLLDDQMVETLVLGLETAGQLMELNLSHNRIGDAGATSLSRLLSRSSSLEALSLADNLVKEDGACSISEALASNQSLRLLDLRLNRLGDSGGATLLLSLRVNRTLRVLNLSCNSLGSEATDAMVELMRCKAGEGESGQEPSNYGGLAIEQLDLSGNLFDEEELPVLLEFITFCPELKACDLRQNSFPAEAEGAAAIVCLLEERSSPNWR